ncbi:MAG TPA: hypothetical protein VEA60_11465 [Allosphingosinicella sp.]|nr:hypothetical protein [Allosphingosinicella sp.]
MGIAETYAEQMRAETRWFAAWEPDSPRKLGDFGPVPDGVFEMFGQLAPDEIKAMGVRESQSGSDTEIMINASRSLVTDAGAVAAAGGASGKALLKMEFSAKNGIAFAASNMTLLQVTDLKALGELLKRRRRAGDWNMDHAVVVQVNRAEKATIILSKESKAEIGFEVAGDVPINPALIANLNASTSVLNVRGVGVKIIGQGPLTPLFKLAYLQHPLFREPEIKYREAVAAGGSEAGEIVPLDDEHSLLVL